MSEITTAYSYARHSGLFAEHAIAAQQKKMQQYATKNDIVIIDRYFDKSNGKSMLRPVLKKMMMDIGEQPVDWIIVTDFSRLARTEFAAKTILFMLALAEIKVVCLSGEDPYDLYQIPSINKL